jgi:type I restriction enzyme S subunit
MFGARRETGFPDLPVLEVSIRSGVRIRDFDNGGRKQEMTDRSKYQRAVRGDITYNMMRMWQGAVGIAPADGLVSPAYVVARPFPETDAAYYAYLFRTAAYMREIDVFSRGIVPDRNRLYWESFKQMPSVYPPLDEQRLIVRFLDWHGAQTAKLVRAKKKLIVLLNEQKQAIIHRAVTRGLDPNVMLKPSGSAWLGDIPAHWDVRRNGRLFSVRRETGFPNLPVLEVSIRSGVRMRDFDNSVRKQEISDRSKYQRAARGDIAYNMMRMWQGAVGIAPSDGLVSPAYVVACPFPDAQAAYYTYLFRTAAYMREIDIFSRGIVPDRNRLYWESFKQITSPYPPLSEQELIARAIDRQTAELNATIATIDREIALIQEFRTRLIADVVTGKLDVRTTAATLPEINEIEPIDEPNDDDDLDETVDDPESEEVAA